MSKIALCCMSLLLCGSVFAAGKCSFDVTEVAADEPELERTIRLKSYEGPYFEATGSIPGAETFEHCQKLGKKHACGLRVDLEYYWTPNSDYQKSLSGKATHVTIAFGGLLGVGSRKAIVECK